MLIPAAPDWSCRLRHYQAEALSSREQQAHYGLLWIEALAEGELELDFVSYGLAPGQAVFWAPGQICRLALRGFSGWRLDFGLDTFCQSGLDDGLLSELGLFAPQAGQPLLTIPAREGRELGQIWQWWQREQDGQAFARQLAGSYLRLVLLRCGRLRAAEPANDEILPQVQNELWPRFRQLLEQNFRRWHAVSTYAETLAVTPGHLNELVKQASGRSAKQLIQDRLMLEARRAAWFSQASLKEIAYELGFEDPAYFSRLFKRCSGQSFSDFREQIRAKA